MQKAKTKFPASKSIIPELLEYIVCVLWPEQPTTSEVIFEAEKKRDILGWSGSGERVKA